MITEQNLCVQCYESITNPICEECHLKEIKHWLEDRKLSGLTKSIIISAIKAAMPKESINENKCILCGNNTLSTCSYCFFLISARVLKELNLSRELVEEFLETFNYTLGHEEYTL